MKKNFKRTTIVILSNIAVIVLLSNCEFKKQYIHKKINNKTKTDSIDVKLSGIKFESINIDCGKINEGKTVEIVYSFKNISDVPLVIYDVKTGCACTSSNYPKTPLLKNETGLLKILFNSKGRVGQNNRSIVVISNSTNKYNKLSFKVEVLPKLECE